MHVILPWAHSQGCICALGNAAAVGDAADLEVEC